MQNYLEELRKRPKAFRAQVAFVTSAIITSLFFVVWAYNLTDRLKLEPADPLLADLQREAEEAEALSVEAPDSTLANVFSRLKRGAAAIIFSDEVLEEKAEAKKETETIDINALLANPPSRPTPTPTTQDPIVVPGESEEQIVVPAGDSNTGAGSVILIGTTSANTTENIE